MTLAKIFFLVAILFNNAGDAVKSQTQGAFGSLEQCVQARTDLINTPPVGLPPHVALVCAETEMEVRRAQGS